MYVCMCTHVYVHSQVLAWCVVDVLHIVGDVGVTRVEKGLVGLEVHLIYVVKPAS